MSKYQCLESINSLYIEHTELGYSATPCCLYKGQYDGHYVDKIEDLKDSEHLNQIREQFKKDWKRPECNDCIMKEQMGARSKRESSLIRGEVGITNWDIRPGNTCNLKCVMCNPWNSSKWHEDIDIFKKYSNLMINEKNRQAREGIDWDYIYKASIDKAEKIYIAGGEPFYMKGVHKFCKLLSQHEWNCKNTEIQIQTNGVSNTDEFIETLKKFERLSFSISIDGWGSVNELIRFPTDHNKFCEHTQQLVDLDCMHLFFNITVQAMNLPNIDLLVSKLQTKWNGRYDIHKLTRPAHLAVDCLKPHIVEKVLDTTKVESLKTFYKDYEYSEERNRTMKRFLIDLDKKRGTDSKKIIPWCFE